MKTFKNIERTKAWATVDSEVGVVGLFERREEARCAKRHAKGAGHKQKVVKLVFGSIVR